MVEKIQKARDVMHANEVSKREAKAAPGEKACAEAALALRKEAVEEAAERAAVAHETAPATPAPSAPPVPPTPAPAPPTPQPAPVAKPVVEERVLTIPLAKALRKQKTRRSAAAAKLIRAFVARHLKVPLERVALEPSLNAALMPCPRRVRVRCAKSADGVRVSAYGA